MAVHFQFKVYEHFWIYGQKHVVVGLEPPYITARREADHKDVVFEYAYLIMHPTFKASSTMAVQVQPDLKGEKFLLSMLQEKQRNKVSERFKIIEPLLLSEQIRFGDSTALQQFKRRYPQLIPEGVQLVDCKQEDIINMVIAQGEVSRPTVMRYLKAYREADFGGYGIEGLIPRTGRGYTGRTDTKVIEICNPHHPEIVLDTITTRLSEQYVEIIKTVIENHYLTKHRRRKQEVYEYAEIECRKLGIKPIPYPTISSIIDRLNPQIAARMRHAANASKQYDEVIRGYGNDFATYPLQVVEIDHTQFDADILDDTRTYEIGRPWITLGIDVFSRELWCCHVGFEEPSINVVRQALMHGIFPKNSREVYHTNSEWDAFGVPRVIYVDNGPDFKSNEVARMVREVLRAELMHRPVKIPHYGAIIERLVGTVNSEFIHRLPGNRGSNPQDLGEYDSAKEASLTLAELRELLHVYFVDVYANSKHEGLPPESPTPRIRFFDGLSKSGFPVLLEEEDKDIIKMELLDTSERLYQRDGIRLGNVRYRAQGRPDLIQAGKKKKDYIVKSDPDDISKIYLKDQNSNSYVELLAYEPAYETLVGMNRYVYDKILKMRKQEGDKKMKTYPTDEFVMQGKERINKALESAYKKSRKTRKQAARSNATITVAVPNSSPAPAFHSKETDLIRVAKEAEAKRRMQRE